MGLATFPLNNVLTANTLMNLNRQIYFRRPRVDLSHHFCPLKYQNYPRERLRENVRVEILSEKMRPSNEIDATDVLPSD